MNKKMLVLENGKVMYGDGFGSSSTKIAEVVFNTSMVGYQEILSDPSYCGKMVVMSYPIIGSYGLTDEDYVSKGVYMSGLIVREYNDNPSNFRSTKTLEEVMQEQDVVGISGVDTRELVRIIRDNGAMKAIITDADRNVKEVLAELNAAVLSNEQVKKVSSKKVWYARTRNPIHKVVALDLGLNLNIVKRLNEYGCNVAVVPYNTFIEDIRAQNPDGILFSNGAGSPLDIPEVVAIARAFKGKIPMLGVGLGCMVLGLACDATVAKMPCGHCGANYPVKNLYNGKVTITEQNHSYYIQRESLEKTLISITHINLQNDEIEGISVLEDNIIGIQYNPETTVAESDSENIYIKFIELMDKVGGTDNAKKNRY